MHRRAFTIVEVMLMATVFVIISSVALANLSGSRGSARLRAAAQEFAAHVKQAQAYAYANVSMSVCTDNLICGSGSSCDPGQPVGCTKTPILSYGLAVDINGDGKRYAIFADIDGSGDYRAGEAIPAGLVTLPAGVTIESIAPPANATMLFSYNAANSQPFVSCSADCTTTIVFFDSQTSMSRSIIVQKQTGAVTLG